MCSRYSYERPQLRTTYCPTKQKMWGLIQIELKHKPENGFKRQRGRGKGGRCYMASGSSTGRRLRHCTRCVSLRISCSLGRLYTCGYLDCKCRRIAYGDSFSPTRSDPLVYLRTQHIYQIKPTLLHILDGCLLLRTQRQHVICWMAAYYFEHSGSTSYTGWLLTTSTTAAAGHNVLSHTHTRALSLSHARALSLAKDYVRVEDLVAERLDVQGAAQVHVLAVKRPPRLAPLNIHLKHPRCNLRGLNPQSPQSYMARGFRLAENPIKSTG